MPDQPDEFLILLTEVARLVRTRADRRARAHGMTRAQWMTLFRLHRQDGMTQRELAELLEVEPITAGRLVDRLACRGLIERRADPADRRVWRLHLTAAADPVLAEIDAARRSFAAVAVQGLSEAERAATRTALLRVKANLLASDAETDTGEAA